MDEPDNLPARHGDLSPATQTETGLTTDPLAREVGFLDVPGNRLKTIALALAVGLVLSDSSIVVLALPDILARYSLSIGQVSWVLTGFNIVLALVAVPVAYVVRRRAPGVLLGLGLTVFAAASLFCAIAPSFEVLLFARGVQAVGGALAVTAALEILPTTTGSERRAATIWATAGALGAAFGPALGGLLTQLISWEAIFFIQVPAILLAIPTLRVKSHAKRIAAGRPKLAPNIALLLLSSGLTAALFLIVLLLIEGWQMSPIATALVVTVIPLSAIVGARAFDNVGSLPARAAAGTILLAAGLAALALLPAPEWWWTVPAQIAIGIGIGITIEALTDAALHGRSPQAVHGGWTLTARHLGLVLGIVALTPIFTQQLEAQQAQVERTGVRLLLDSPLPLSTRVALAGRLGVVVQDANGRIPNIGDVFSNVPSDPAERTAWTTLQDQLAQTIREAGTAAAALPFLVSAGLVLLALVPIGLGRRHLDL
ncbi:MAG: MFS transporter [Thermoleophilia bacterium]|nr:MAG: MFS transporter [Thermoleophilia bacterium]